MYSLQNPLEPEFLFEYPYGVETFSVGIDDNLFFQGSYSIYVYDVENGYDYYNPINDFETPFNADVRYFFEEDEEDYMLLTSETGISLYKYEYDNSSVSDNEISSENYQFSNYPNPFNSSTTISFSLNTENTENTEISIFNIKGQKVKTLECINHVNAEATRSLHSITWNGDDNSGRAVSSGIYFYRLKTGDGKFSSTKKMILLR